MLRNHLLFTALGRTTLSPTLRLVLNLRQGNNAIRLVSRLECLLQTEHLIAYVVADLDRNSIFELKLLATAVLKYRLALLIGALILPAPLFMLVD